MEIEEGTKSEIRITAILRKKLEHRTSVRKRWCFITHVPRDRQVSAPLWCEPCPWCAAGHLLLLSKPISPALTLSWSTVPLPDCLDMVEWACVGVGFSILESSVIPATGHYEEHLVPEPHCKLSSYLNCAPFGSQYLLPSPMVVPGCSLATGLTCSWCCLLGWAAQTAQCQPQVKHPGEDSRNCGTKVWHVLAREKALCLWDCG